MEVYIGALVVVQNPHHAILISSGSLVGRFRDMLWRNWVFPFERVASYCVLGVGMAWRGLDFTSFQLIF